MKPFYGIDRTENKKNTFHEGDCFIAASVCAISGSAMEQAAQRADEQLRKSRLPFPLGGIRTAAGFVFAFLFISTIRSLGNVTIPEAYSNAPALFWIQGGCAAVWLVLTVLASRIRKTAEGDESFQIAVKALEDRIDAAFRELQVPANAKDVDVICVRYRWKDGKLKAVASGFETSERSNEQFKAFRLEDRLCFANTEHRYEFPMGELKCLRSVKKHIYSQGWNKEESFNAGFYKPYKLTMDNYNRVHMKSYGQLELEHDGVAWSIWLPPYELNYISALTGLPITEE
jgi:hypothetical protein